MSPEQSNNVVWFHLAYRLLFLSRFTLVEYCSRLLLWCLIGTAGLKLQLFKIGRLTVDATVAK